MEKYKVVFFGTPKIAQEILATLLTMPEIEVVLVVSQPDKTVGRKQEVVYGAVKQFCLDQQLTLLQPNKVIEIYDELVKLAPDFLITCAYGQFIPSKILALPKIEPLNIHGSLLPKYRGGAPIQYAILNGDQETGVSLMRMVKEMDAGPVFSTKSLTIDPHETSGTLFPKIAKLGQEIILEDLLKIAKKSLTPTSQDETQVSFAYNITSEQEQIDWSKSAQEIDCLTRALYPKPVSFTILNKQRYKIGLVQVIPQGKVGQPNQLPGTILEFDHEGILVQTGKDLAKILEIQVPGKKLQPAANYFASQGTKELQVGSTFSF